MLLGDPGQIRVGPVARGRVLGQVQHLAHQQAVEGGEPGGVIGDEVGRGDAIDVEEHDRVPGGERDAAVARGGERQRLARHPELAHRERGGGEIVEVVLHHRDDELGGLLGLAFQAAEHVREVGGTALGQGDDGNGGHAER